MKIDQARDHDFAAPIEFVQGRPPDAVSIPDDSPVAYGDIGLAVLAGGGIKDPDSEDAPSRFHAAHYAMTSRQREQKTRIAGKKNAVPWRSQVW